MSQLDRYSIRRVVLPSGKTIEVVYFDDAPPATAGAGTETELHLCGHCGADTVYPVVWEEAGPDSWEMTLRCPNCEAVEEGVFSQEQVECLEEALDDGTDALVRDLRILARANMEEEVERFAEALRDDLILPMDF